MDSNPGGAAFWERNQIRAVMEYLIALVAFLFAATIAGVIFMKLPST